ncbi:MAG: GNAT family N-acetyltransferase [Bacilli bacterium]|nr:GNAT family N-acetyltransferase [Bacilli bacterium]
MVRFEHYQRAYYQMVCDFFVTLNRESPFHDNWNWARFEWMHEHPLTNQELLPKMGLWLEGERVIGAALIDMFLGEAFVGVLPKHKEIYPEILDYAFGHLKDDQGLGVAFHDGDAEGIQTALKKGFFLTDGGETVAEISLKDAFPIFLPEGFSVEDFDAQSNAKEMAWLFYQGFDHGDNQEEFLADYREPTMTRPHFDPYLCVAIRNAQGELVASASTWYDPRTDFAYVEPVCVIPKYRKMGLGKAAVYTALNHAREYGVRIGVVNSDQVFYQRLGFVPKSHYSFYWKKEERTIHGVTYRLERLLGKGKGGYSYLAKANHREYVLKQIHHEPCAYYQFGNKIEAERNDYQRLLDAGIRIPKMIDIDIEQEVIIKEYIDGEVIADMIRERRSVESFLPQLEEMARLAKEQGLNIDYYPTNFVVKDGQLHYIDYECNSYMEEWSLERWGLQYWNGKAAL